MATTPITIPPTAKKTTKLQKLERMILPPDNYSSPATGLSTEKGDSWLGLGQKFNALVDHVEALSSGAVTQVKSATTAVEAVPADIASIEARIEARFQSVENMLRAFLIGKVSSTAPLPSTPIVAPTPDPVPSIPDTPPSTPPIVRLVTPPAAAAASTPAST